MKKFSLFILLLMGVPIFNSSAMLNCHSRLSMRGRPFESVFWKKLFPKPQQCLSQELIKKAKESMDPLAFDHFLEVYKSFFFFDPYQVMFHNVLATQAGNSHPAVPTQFNQNGQFPIDGYLAAGMIMETAREKSLKDLLKRETLLSAHRALLSKESILPKRGIPHPNHSEGALDTDLGEIRGGCWYIDLPPRTDLATELTQEHLLKTANGKTLADPAHPITYLQAIENNPYLRKRANENNIIEYPCLRYPTDLNRYSQLYPNQFPPKTLTHWKNQLKSIAQLNIIQAEEANEKREHLNRKFITSLLDFELVQLNTLLSKEGLSEGDIIEIVGKFQWRLLSLHPFPNGNGRLARVLTEKILEHFHINPPLTLHWGEDILLREESFLKIFKDSIELSNKFHARACAKVQQLGIDALDVGVIVNQGQTDTEEENQNQELGIDFIKDLNTGLGISEYRKWASEENLGFAIEPTEDILEPVMRPLMASHFKTFKAYNRGERSELFQYEHLKEKDEDSFEISIFRENLLLKNLAEKVGGQGQKLYSWQSPSSVEHYLANGQNFEDTILFKDLAMNVNLMGDGLYASANPYDSAEYSKTDGQALVIDLFPEDKILDTTRPEVYHRLFKFGLSPEQLPYLSHNLIHKYQLDNSFNRLAPPPEWMVIKRPIKPEHIHILNHQDIPEEKLNLYLHYIKSTTYGTNSDAAIKVLENQIMAKKSQFQEDVLLGKKMNSRVSPFWSPFGECLEQKQEVDGLKLKVVSANECRKIHGSLFHYDVYLAKCLELTPSPENAFIQRVDMNKCQDQQSRHLEKYQQESNTLFDDLLLDQKTVREADDLLLLHQGHFYPQEDSLTGEIKSYRVLGMKKSFDYFIKEFSSQQKQQALDYLQRVPFPINFDRYAERVIRNYRFFAQYLSALTPVTQHALTKEQISKAMKREVSQSLPDLKSKFAFQIPYELKKLSTFQVTLKKSQNFHEFNEFMEKLKLIPGFVVQNGHGNVTLYPYKGEESVSFENSSSQDHQNILIEGMMDGIPLRLRVKLI